MSLIMAILTSLLFFFGPPLGNKWIQEAPIEKESDKLVKELAPLVIFPLWVLLNVISIAMWVTGGYA